MSRKTERKTGDLVVCHRSHWKIFNDIDNSEERIYLVSHGRITLDLRLGFMNSTGPQTDWWSRIKNDENEDEESR